MIKYFIFLILVISNSACTHKPMQLILENHDGSIVMSIKNVSEKDILLNQRLGLNSEITFNIVDKNGVNFTFQGDGLPCHGFEKYLKILKPGMTISQEVLITHLGELFHLKSDVQYRIKAKYKNRCWIKKGVFDGSLESNWVTFEGNGGPFGMDPLIDGY